MAQVNVGVLCIQGAFIEHIRKLEAVKALKDSITLSIKEVRKPEELSGLDGLIVPGGESTTLSVFLGKDDFDKRLAEYVKGTAVVWGTCAGLILFSDHLFGQKTGGQVIIGGLAVESTRNLFGRQVSSFEGDVEIQEPSLQYCIDSKAQKVCHGVFIRAPGINKLLSQEVKVLANLCDEEKTVVAIQQGNVMATCFHPELTDDLRWHVYFIDCILQRTSAN